MGGITGNRRGGNIGIERGIIEIQCCKCSAAGSRGVHDQCGIRSRQPLEIQIRRHGDRAAYAHNAGVRLRITEIDGASGDAGEFHGS